MKYCEYQKLKYWYKIKGLQLETYMDNSGFSLALGPLETCGPPGGGPGVKKAWLPAS
jgi:hypothetical protein